MRDSDIFWCVDLYSVDEAGETTYIKSVYFRTRSAAMRLAVEVNAKQDMMAVLGSSQVEHKRLDLVFEDEPSE